MSIIIKLRAKIKGNSRQVKSLYKALANVNQKGVKLNTNIKVEIFSLKTNIRKP